MRRVVGLWVMGLMGLLWAWSSLQAAGVQKVKGKTAAQLIQEMDSKLQGNSSIMVAQMKIVTPRWKRSLKMKLWTKGKDYAFVRILSPQRERGMASLKRKMQMWNYLPRSEMVIKIPPSMMMGSWMGSDFSNDDLVRASNVSRDYFAKILAVKTRNKVKQIQIELKPKPKAPVVWSKIIVWMRHGDLLPTRQEYYNQKGKRIRIMDFRKIKKMGGRSIPTVMEVRRLSKKGHKTVITYLKAKFNIRISRRIFTPTQLKRKNW